MQERALEAMGLLFSARPDLVMDPAVQQIMQQALSPAMPALLKLRALSNLLNLIKVQPLSHRPRPHHSVTAGASPAPPLTMPRTGHQNQPSCCISASLWACM